MKKQLSFIVAVFLLFSAIVSFAKIKTDIKTDLASISLDGLSKAEKSILRITLYTAIKKAHNGEPITGYSHALDIQFSDYSLEQLEALHSRLTDDATAMSIESQKDKEHQSIINAVKQSCKKHFNDEEPIEVNLYGDNLLIEVSGNSNLTRNLIRTGMHIDIYEVMNENRNPPVDFDFLISFPLIDKYGNSEPAIVMKVTFKSETMAKINWDNFYHIDIERVADRYWYMFSK